MRYAERSSVGGSCGPTGSTIAPAVKQVFLGFPPLVETIALAVHFQDMDMVGEAVQQSPGQAFRAEYLRPLIERQVGGHQDRAPLVALAEDFEQQLGAGLREREAEFVDDGDTLPVASAGATGVFHPWSSSS